MDAIEALDDGANAHFTWQSRELPVIVGYMQVAYYISSYVGIGVGGESSFTVAKRHREPCRRWESRLRGALPCFRPGAASRPQLAIEWLGRTRKRAVIPAAVFLFMPVRSSLLCCDCCVRVAWLDRSCFGSLDGMVCIVSFLATHVSDVIDASAGRR